MKDVNLTSGLGIDVESINKDYDNDLYYTANQMRKTAAEAVASSASWKDINLQDSMLSSVLERTPLCNSCFMDQG